LLAEDNSQDTAKFLHFSARVAAPRASPQRRAGLPPNEAGMMRVS